MKNAVIGQSGGPTAAINATLAGVIEGCAESKNIKTLYGAVNGIEGILAEKLIDLTDISKDSIELLKTTPGAYLGSCRRRIAEDEIDRIFAVMEKFNIGYFFYIGGNDSMDTVSKLSAKSQAYGIKVIGIPKTVDNDLYGTDHCPGFGSAAKFVATSVMEIARDCTGFDMESVTIVEIMGRNAGWLTAASALARCNGNTAPDLIYLPERTFKKDRFLADVRSAIEKKKSIVAAISEGIRDEGGRYIAEETSDFKNDSFGHSQLGGAGKVLEQFIKKVLRCKARTIELSLLQRSAAHLLSETDLLLSVKIGRSAVEAAEGGATGVMMCFKHKGYNPFVCQIETADIHQIANTENKVPDIYINSEGNGVTDKFIEYATPLIMGSVPVPVKNGLPVHLIRV